MAAVTPGGAKDSGVSLYGITANDPAQQLFDRAGLSQDDLAQLDRLFAATARLREVERRVLEASRGYMRLNETDMRALHFVITRENHGELVTPRELAEHLGITTASTTKLLDRLERGGHVRRAPHPSDRRALTIRVSAETRAAAMQSMGRSQASRIAAAAALSPEHREVVIAFLQRSADDLAASIAAAGGPHAGGPVDGAAAADAETTDAEPRGPGAS